MGLPVVVVYLATAHCMAATSRGNWEDQLLSGSCSQVLSVLMMPEVDSLTKCLSSTLDKILVLFLYISINVSLSINNSGTRFWLLH